MGLSDPQPKVSHGVAGECREALISGQGLAIRQAVDGAASGKALNTLKLEFRCNVMNICAMPFGIDEQNPL